MGRQCSRGEGTSEHKDKSLPSLPAVEEPNVLINKSLQSTAALKYFCVMQSIMRILVDPCSISQTQILIIPAIHIWRNTVYRHWAHALCAWSPQQY